jgi:hypothetical protein
MTHLYSFFGSLLQCSHYSQSAFPAYTGHASMYEVHKFMALDSAEVGYFITQVALAAASFGVAESDLTAVGAALNALFARRCAPAVEVVKPQGAELQAICIAEDCMLADGAVCGLYDDVVQPGNATMTSSGGGGGAMTTMTMTTTDASGSVMTMTSISTAAMTPTTVPTAGAAVTGLSLMAVAGGIAALLI